MSRPSLLTLAAVQAAVWLSGTAVHPQQQPAEPTSAQAAEDEEIPAETTPRRARRRPRLDSSNTGYIDNAIIGTRLSLRADSARGADEPDRGELFYAKCGCFANPALRGILGAAFDPSAPGPGLLPESRVDYQELEIAYEMAFPGQRFSLFAELPLRHLELRDNGVSSSGLADLRLGAKLALIARQERHLTFQLRVYLPTGDAGDGLGTNHASLEPGLLLHQELSDRLSLAGELKYLFAASGSLATGLSADPADDFSSDLLRYGLSLSRRTGDGDGLEVTPVAEIVGWQVIDGYKTAGPADGDQIVNLKLGARIRGSFSGSWYLGYGFALTDDVWYDEIFRLEYRYSR